MNRDRDWLRQAENDLQWARHSAAGGFYAQVCSIAQQAGEKALKAYCFNQGFDIVRTHSLMQLVRALEENGELEKAAKALDLFYLSGRYPDAFPAGAPFEMIDQEQADRGLQSAQFIYEWASARMRSE